MSLPSGGALHIDGPAGAVPVLFLHGVGGGAWSWKPQREAFSPAYRLFIWEARGHGLGAPVADAGLADYYTDAREALAAVFEEAHRPAFIVGHSLGGLLALALGSDVAGAIRGHFLIEPAYATGDEMLVRVLTKIGPYARLPFEPIIRSYARNGALSRAITRFQFERMFEDRARMEAAWPDQRAQVPLAFPQMFREGFHGPRDFHLRNFAKEIHDPTYVLEGSRGLRRPRFPRLVNTLREQLAEDFTYESIQGGHYLQLDRPDSVNERMRRFLETSPA